MEPAKRNIALQPLSHEHHYGLLVCFKIRQGLKKQIAPERIKAFCDFFYYTQLRDHFEVEEKYVFPVLGKEDELIVRALKEHETLRILFEEKKSCFENLTLIENYLESHIRFEERELFNKVQMIAREDQLQAIENIRLGNLRAIESWEDNFWE